MFHCELGLRNEQLDRFNEGIIVVVGRPEQIRAARRLRCSRPHCEVLHVFETMTRHF